MNWCICFHYQCDWNTPCARTLAATFPGQRGKGKLWIKTKTRDYGKGAGRRSLSIEEKEHLFASPAALCLSVSAGVCLFTSAQFQLCGNMREALSHEEERNFLCDKETLVCYLGTRHRWPLWSEPSHDLNHERTVPSIFSLPSNASMMFFLSLQEITKFEPRWFLADLNIKAHNSAVLTLKPFYASWFIRAF